MNRCRLVLAAYILLLVTSVSPRAQDKPEYRPPDDVAFRKASIVSEGTRMVAEVFALKRNEDKPLPTIIMCHGWGGLAAQLRPDAVAFARAGYFVVAFDYRGWGQSDGRLLLVKPATKGKSGAPFTAEVKEVREVVDPLDQTTDLLNVIHWVQGEKQCNKRIGLWGSSYSGGHVVYAAQRDPRVRATVSQVPALDSRWVLLGPGRRQTFMEATKRARGEIGYPAPGVKLGNLRGAPIRERLMNYAPVEEMDKAPKCAMLFVIAEKEELFNNKDHGIKAHERARGPKKLVTIPGITHYDIYGPARAQAQKLAIEWYDQHLMVAASK
ncbi:MAG: alpha/beta fold hydrolase [Planctomycetes bacterium]|nr:alpha/beta fold hydrolase [Planctomycetota bacterium]